MKRFIVEVVVGLILIISSFIVGFLQLEGILSNSLFLLVAIFLAVIGMGVLFNAGRLDFGRPKFKDLFTPSKDTAGTFEKNKQMVAEWNKTADARDKLKVLEAAANAESGKK
jgi:hypothetical protein